MSIEIFNTFDNITADLVIMALNHNKVPHTVTGKSQIGQGIHYQQEIKFFVEYEYIESAQSVLSEQGLLNRSDEHNDFNRQKKDINVFLPVLNHIIKSLIVFGLFCGSLYYIYTLLTPFWDKMKLKEQLTSIAKGKFNDASEFIKDASKEEISSLSFSGYQLQNDLFLVGRDKINSQDFHSYVRRYRKSESDYGNESTLIFQKDGRFHLKKNYIKVKENKLLLDYSYEFIGAVHSEFLLVEMNRVHYRPDQKRYLEESFIKLESHPYIEKIENYSPLTESYDNISPLTYEILEMIPQDDPSRTVKKSMFGYYQGQRTRYDINVRRITKDEKMTTIETNESYYPLKKDNVGIEEIRNKCTITLDHQSQHFEEQCSNYLLRSVSKEEWLKAEIR